MTPRGPGSSFAEPPPRRLVFAIGLFVTGALLFTWPFVRVPRLHLVPAYVHLVAAWVVIVAMLSVLARSLRTPRAPPAGRPEPPGA